MELILENLDLQQLLDLLPAEISRETKNGYENSRIKMYKKQDKHGNIYRIACYYWGYESEEKKNCTGREIHGKGKTLKIAIIAFINELARIHKFNQHLIYKRIK